MSLDAQRAKLRHILHNINHAEPLRRRAIQQTILEAEAWWWAWRAEQFHHAAPQPTDYNGAATPTELEAARERCLNTARACWNHAHLLQQEAADDAD